jgi:hypothetical protein
MPDLFANFYFLLFAMITVIVVVVTIAITWATANQSSAEFAFKAKLVERGMSAEEIERVMAASSSPLVYRPSGIDTSLDEDALNEVVSVLGQAQTPAAVIEEVLWAFRSTDAATQALISSAIQHLVGSADNVDGEQILAVVRPLTGPKAEPPAPVALVRDERIMREG